MIGVLGSTGATAGLQAGLLVWLGFVATISAANGAFSDRGGTVWGIEAGNHLVTLLLMGLVLTLMPERSRPDRGRRRAEGRARYNPRSSAAFRRG